MAIITPDIDLIIGIVLLLIGLVMAFFGKLIWAMMMSLIGALIGGLLGYIIGMLLGGWLFALILSLILAILLSMVFGYLVELGLALVLGLMGFALVYLSFPGTGGIIGGAIVLGIIFAVAYYFIEEVVAGATALIGGILTGVGVFFLTYDLGLSIGVGLMIFVTGALVQIFALRKHRMRRR
jgi:hypothetical protein